MGYKHLFSFIQLLRELIEDYVEGEWKKYLDYEKAEKVQKSYILPEFENQESDIIYKIPLKIKKKNKTKTVFLFVLIENQSTVDFSIPLRILFYIVEIWRDYYKNADEKERRNKDFRLPPIFPLVLYNGEGAYTAPRTIKDMVEEGELFGEYLPSLRYALVNICALSDEEILAKKNGLASVFLLEKKIGRENIGDLWQTICELMEGEDELLWKGILEWLIMNFKQRDASTSEIGKINMDKLNPKEGRSKIGRASCRERV